MRRPHLTYHAQDRWEERFAAIEPDIWKAFERAIPFAGQKRGDKSFLDVETGAVFIITPDYSIRTILTQEQSYVNIQAFGSRRNEINFDIRALKPEPEKKKKIKPTAKLYTNQQLEQYAKEHVERYGASYCKNNKKKFKEELRLLGIPEDSGDREIYREFLFKYIRQKNAINA